MTKIVALIPARYASTRLPGKLLLELNGKSIIRTTYDAVCSTKLFSQVIVVCDDASIHHEVVQHGGDAVMSEREYESGTDRIAEVAAKIDADIVVNIQGDEPFISKEALEKVIDLFQHQDIDVGTLMIKITDQDKINNPNCVKVVVDSNSRALYFSRAPIPFYRDVSENRFSYQHIGVYAFRKESLVRFSKLPLSNLEQIEKLENLRMLENRFNVYLAEISHVGISIDTEEDYQHAISYLNQGSTE